MTAAQETHEVPATAPDNRAWFWPGFFIAWIFFALAYANRLDYIPGHFAFWATIASTGFLIAAWTPNKEQRDPFSIWIFLGLICCCIGDLIGPFHFMTGANAFFFAQTFFSIAAWKKGINWRWATPMIPVMIASNAALLWYTLPGTPDEEVIKVIAYSVIISIMVITAVGACSNNVPLAWAGILFYVSDVFVALWRFGDSPASGWICYPIYYSACLLFAYCVHVDRAGRVKDTYS